MGASLLKRWLDDARFKTITVLEPFDLPAEFKCVAHHKTPDGIPANPDILILAVKPQIMAEVCASLKPVVGNKTVILSIAAGTPLAFFETAFGPQTPIIRTMPNTPASIGMGATVAIANAHCTPAHKALANKALNGTGLVEWIDDEGLMNAVTALSGSGPAYVFYLIEVLEKAGIELGMPQDLAGKLARQTVIGSAALADTSPETAAGTLRENVTSPGGTTAAALDVLMNGELEALFKKALKAAENRGRELASPRS